MRLASSALKQIAFSSALGIILYILNVSFVNLLFLAYPETRPLVFGSGTWWLQAPAAVKFVYVGFISPIIEELIFRNGIMSYFIRNNQYPSALIISTVLFALYHILFGWGYLKAVLMLVPGLVFGVLYARYGLKGCLSCHLSNNIMAAIALASS